MAETQRFMHFLKVLQRRPDAQAVVSGSNAYPGIRGLVRFYQTAGGVLVAAEISGLPTSDRRCDSDIFAFHIHCGERCTGNREDPFANAREHYNPERCPHPAHAGDMPPLFASDGTAAQVFLTDRFTVREIIGKTVVIHDDVDDFTSQPSGNPGGKIACGEIRRTNCR